MRTGDIAVYYFKWSKPNISSTLAWSESNNQFMFIGQSHNSNKIQKHGKWIWYILDADDNKTFSVEDIGTQQYFIAMVEIIMCYKMMEIVHKNKVSYKPCRSISSVVW